MSLKNFITVVAIGCIAFSGLVTNVFASQKPLIWVWYPNESTPEKASSRKALIEHISKALGGRKITEQLTTDYSIAIEAVVHGNAVFSWLGAEGYIQANNKEPAVQPIVTNSKTASLEDAKYFSMLGVRKDNADKYIKGGNFNFDILKQVRFSFVSNSSTSGFRVPSAVIAKHFNVKPQDLLEGGKKNIFSEVLFGGSHQLSLLNIIEKRADAGVFCNTCVAAYIEFSKGDFNNPQIGDIVKVLSDAPAPFNAHKGEEVIIAYSVPVLNAPLVVNTKFVTPEELAAIKAELTSESTLNDSRLFGNLKDPNNAAIFEKGERFIVVEDKWYNPVRLLSGAKPH